MDDGDWQVGQSNTRVQNGNRWGIPVINSFQVDFCDYVAGEFKGGGDSRNVISNSHRADGHGDVQDGAESRSSSGDLCIGHNTVRRAEIHGTRGNLVNTGAGTNRLIINLDTGDFSVFTEPFGIQGIWERGTCTV